MTRGRRASASGYLVVVTGFTLVAVAGGCSATQRGFPVADVPSWCSQVSEGTKDSELRASRLELLAADARPSDLTTSGGVFDRLQQSARADLIARVETRFRRASAEVLLGGLTPFEESATANGEGVLAHFYEAEFADVLTGIHPGRLAYGTDVRGQTWACAEAILAKADHLAAATRALERKRAEIVEAFEASQELLSAGNTRQALRAMAHAWYVLRTRVGDAPVLLGAGAARFDLQTRLPFEMNRILGAYRIVVDPTRLVVSRGAQASVVHATVLSGDAGLADVPIDAVFEDPACATRASPDGVTDGRGRVDIQVYPLATHCPMAQVRVSIALPSLMGSFPDDSVRLPPNLLVPATIVRVFRQRRIGVDASTALFDALSNIVAQDGDLAVPIPAGTALGSKAGCLALAERDDLDALVVAAVSIVSTTKAFSSWYASSAAGSLKWMPRDACVPICSRAFGPVQGDNAISEGATRASALARATSLAEAALRHCLTREPRGER